jgi:hypothetical protein
MSSMNNSVSITESCAASPGSARADQHQRDGRGEHVEAAVDAVRHLASRYQKGSRPAATTAS